MGNFDSVNVDFTEQVNIIEEYCGQFKDENILLTKYLEQIHCDRDYSIYS